MTSVIYRQHKSTMIKTFEELLQASDVDRCVAEGFQEQLTQCAELPEQLEKLFLHGKWVKAVVQYSLTSCLGTGRIHFLALRIFLPAIHTDLFCPEVEQPSSSWSWHVISLLPSSFSHTLGMSFLTISIMLLPLTDIPSPLPVAFFLVFTVEE